MCACRRIAVTSCLLLLMLQPALAFYGAAVGRSVARRPSPIELSASTEAAELSASTEAAELSASTEPEKPRLANITLSIPSSNVLLVDSLNTLTTMCASLLGYEATVSPILGVDCEWRPEGYRGGGAVAMLPQVQVKDSLLERLWRAGRRVLDNRKGSSNSSRRSGGGGDRRAKPMSEPVLVLQVATRERVFIIDLQTLLGTNPNPNAPLLESERLLDSLFSRLFQSRAILKVGLGPQQDLKRLAWSYPRLASLLRFCCVLDVSALAKKRFPGVAGRQLEGLSKLSALVLGKAVDKSCQCSAWHERPLSTEQLTYAAIDAHVLTLLYDELLAGAQVDVPALCHDYVCGAAAGGTQPPGTLRGFAFAQTRSPH